MAHVAAEIGVSRQCAHRWVARFDAHGDLGLAERRPRPRRSPTRTSAEAKAQVIAERVQHRRGQDWLAGKLGLPARTINRVLHGHQMPNLAMLDPVTGQVIRSLKATAQRYERQRPGELVHVDVKKFGKIPDGGG